MAGENVANFFISPNTGTANTLNIGGILDINAGGRIKGDVGTGTCVSNAVTINKMAGVITTEALTTAGGASQAIVLTDSVIAVGDIILVTLAAGTNTVKNITLQAVATASTGTITIFNNTAATALNGTLIINFLVIKAA
jgi:hypothetical protein